MATESRNVISTFALAGLNSAADTLSFPFASPLSITGIAMTAAGFLASGVVAPAIAISAVR